MSLEIGSRVGRYEIRGPLGRGGMGEVYLAQDSELGRSVALKVLPMEVAGDTDRMRRFALEAKAASALNHPNILTIHEIGREGSTSFIATELVEGVTLRNRMESARIAIPEALDIAGQIASALAVAHAAGIVHRDVKPENVMLRRDGFVKLLDFGLAKMSPLLAPAEAPTLTGPMTQAGMVMGTAHYMSPEQACGLPVDARTDVWSLGVVLFEMVTRQLPIQGTSAGEILSELVQGTEPPPLARFAPDVPAELQRIVTRALAPNREKRYHSMQDLALDLKELREKNELEARLAWNRPPSGPSTASAPAATAAPSPHTEPWRRLRQALPWATLVAASAVAIAVYLRPPSAAAAAIDSLAVLPFATTGADADTELLADGLTESLNNSLSRITDLRLIARGSVFRYKGKEVDLGEAASELGVRALVTGRLTRLGDQLQIGVELTDVQDNRHLWGEQFRPQVADLLVAQQQIGSAIAEQLRSRLPRLEKERIAKGPTENPEAYRLYLLGRHYWYKFPRPEFQKSREYFEQAIDLDPTYALAHAGLAIFYGFSAANGLLSPAETWPKAQAAVQEALKLDPNLAEAHQVLASQKMFIHRDWAGAERSFKRAIELNPNYAEIYPLYGALLLFQGRVEESLAIKRKAQELDPLSATFHRRWGRHLYTLRKDHEAIAEYREALDLDPGDPLAHELLGDAHEMAGRPGDAVQEWSLALTLAGNEDQAALLERSFAESGFETAIRILASAKLAQLRKRAESGQYVPAIDFARLHLRLGEREPAFEWLAKAEQEQTRALLAIGVEPAFDSIRADPRFVDLLRRLGLPNQPIPPPR